MFHNQSLEQSVTGGIPSSGVTRSGMLLKSSSSELSLGGGYTGDFGCYSWTVGCPLSWSGGEVGEVLSWSSSSSELISKGASWVVKGWPPLLSFLGFGTAFFIFFFFLILLSCTCLEKWEGQGPDMRPSALGLYFLVGLGDQLLLPLCPCLPVVLLRLIPVCVFCCANLMSLSLVTLLGVWYLFQGFLQVDEVQGSLVTAEWPLGVLTYTLRVHCVLWHPDCHEDFSPACPSSKLLTLLVLGWLEEL